MVFPTFSDDVLNILCGIHNFLIKLERFVSIQIEEYNIDTEFYPSGIKNYRTFFRWWKLRLLKDFPFLEHCSGEPSRASFGTSQVVNVFNIFDIFNYSLYVEPGPGDSPEGRTGQWIVQSLRCSSPCIKHLFSDFFCTLLRPCCFHYLSKICQRNPEMELRLEPKNSRAPNPYGSFPWMLGNKKLFIKPFVLPAVLYCRSWGSDVWKESWRLHWHNYHFMSSGGEVLSNHNHRHHPLLQVYTCDSGACIALANKCNSKIECLDESDETNCQYLEVL